MTSASEPEIIKPNYSFKVLVHQVSISQKYYLQIQQDKIEQSAVIIKLGDFPVLVIKSRTFVTNEPQVQKPYGIGKNTVIQSTAQHVNKVLLEQ